MQATKVARAEKMQDWRVPQRINRFVQGTERSVGNQSTGVVGLYDDE